MWVEEGRGEVEEGVVEVEEGMVVVEEGVVEVEEEERMVEVELGLVARQTLQPVLEEQQAVLGVGGVRGGRGVAELGVRLVAL